MRKHINQIMTSLFLISGFIAVAQDKDDKDEKIGTEVVNVVKPYTPTISDAFKVKETPSIDDDETTTKKSVSYNIYSVPVASTFKPAKGRAAGVKKKAREKLYDSYAAIGLGNFASGVLDFYTSRALNRDETLDISLNHHSTQGGIEDVRLDDKFFDTKVDLSYKKKGRDLKWGGDVGYQNQIYNWYGIYDNTFDQATINSIDEKQTYHSAYLSGNASLEDSFFKKADFTYRRTWDAFSSGENRAFLKPTFEFPIAGELINTNFVLDYVGGSFDNNFAGTGDINYGNLLIGVNPSLVILRDDLTVNLGAAIYYGMDLEGSDGDVFIYPRVTASYRLVDEYVIAYAGIEGDLIQNSYFDFVQDNQFVSPTLLIAPTDQQYDGYVGLKGKFLPNVGYNIRGNYRAENNKPLFKLNRSIIPGVATQEFQKTSTFQVVYDDVTTFSAFGEINVDVNRNFKLGIKGEYFTYSTDTEDEAWNLPELKFSLFGDYQIDEHWFAGANIFYVGERLDSFVTPDDGTFTLPTIQTITLDGFFDVNLHAGYRFNDKLSVFAKVNNLANQDYQRWATYQVQQLQAMAGLVYKFDFGN